MIFDHMVVAYTPLILFYSFRAVPDVSAPCRQDRLPLPAMVTVNVVIGRPRRPDEQLSPLP
jgi:hypothetical protein